MRRFQSLIVKIVLVTIWCLSLFFLLRKTDSISSDGTDLKDLNKLYEKIDGLIKENSLLKKANENNKNHGNSDLKSLEEKLQLCKRSQLLNKRSSLEKQNNNDLITDQILQPYENHDQQTRIILNDVVEIGYSLSTEFRNLKKTMTPETLDEALVRLEQQRKTIEIDIEDLRQSTESNRRSKAEKLNDLVKRRIEYLQNPSDCGSSQQLLCKLNKGCGFGCQFHHLIYCFMIAYGTQRTLVLDSKNWRYNADGWETIFQPVSDTCTVAANHPVNWKGEQYNKNDQVVLLPIVDGLNNRPPYLPLGIPEDISDKIIQLHSDPSAWWVGQFARYLWRPQQWLLDDMAETKRKLDIEKPIVGIQVRRTDKINTEAAFHNVEEYMEHVEAWYDKLALRRLKEGNTDPLVRRVYVASDDASVLPEARRKYPSYTFYGDVDIANSASLNQRYSKISLRGVIMDIHFLSNCDYLVCTFSSQVCRVAYELMQTEDRSIQQHPLFHSLDDIYYFGGQTAHNLEVRYDHEASPRLKEIELKVGDLVGIAGNHWDGQSKGVNRRTKSGGLYPSYKVLEKYELVKYPVYPQVPIEK